MNRPCRWCQAIPFSCQLFLHLLSHPMTPSSQFHLYKSRLNPLSETEADISSLTFSEGKSKSHIDSDGAFLCSSPIHMTGGARSSSSLFSFDTQVQGGAFSSGLPFRVMGEQEAGVFLVFSSG